MTKVTQTKREKKGKKKNRTAVCVKRGKQVENTKLELEGASERGIKAERDSEKEDRVQEKLRLRGQGQENKNILSFFSGS